MELKSLEDWVINAHAGGSFIEAGLPQVNVREVGLVKSVPDIADKVIKTQHGTPLRVRDIALRKGADSDSTFKGIHDKVDELNNCILPTGVKLVPFSDRSELVEPTTHTVLHKLTEATIPALRYAANGMHHSSRMTTHQGLRAAAPIPHPGLPKRSSTQTAPLRLMLNTLTFPAAVAW